MGVHWSFSEACMGAHRAHVGAQACLGASTTALPFYLKQGAVVVVEWELPCVDLCKA